MLKTNRISLSLYTDKDQEEVLQMYFEKDAFKYIAPLQNKTRSEYISFLSTKRDEILTERGYYWIIRTNEDNVMIGAINLTPITRTEEIQIGWQIKEKFRKQGYALEAAKLALNFGIHHTHFNPIYAVFESENIASKRILEKLDFKFYQAIPEKSLILKKYIFNIER